MRRSKRNSFLSSGFASFYDGIISIVKRRRKIIGPFKFGTNFKEKKIAKEY
jgi:hypothetical protein